MRISSQFVKMARKSGHFFLEALWLARLPLVFIVRKFLLLIGILFLLIILFWVLIFYMHFHPYGNSRFDRDEWIAEGMKGQEGDRCSMANTVVEDIIKPGMSRHDVEAILGPIDQPAYKTPEGYSVFIYDLGWCSPMAMDPYLLKTIYDDQERLIDIFNLQG